MKKLLFALVAVALFPVSSVSAETLLAEFRGTITGFTSPSFLGGIVVGDPFVFRVFYDYNPTIHQGNSHFENNVFVPSTDSTYWWFGKGYSMSAVFGEYEISTVDNTTFDVRNNSTQHGIAIYNAFKFASGKFSTESTGGVSISLISSPETAPSFPGATLSSFVDYPISVFDLSNAFRAVGSFDGVYGDVHGQITEYHVGPVPIVPTSWLLLGGLGVLGALSRTQRIGTGCTAAAPIRPQG